MKLTNKLFASMLAIAIAGSAHSQSLDLFGSSATTTMTNTGTGLFTQQTVGLGDVTANVTSAADAAGNVGLLTGGTSIVETYSDRTSGNDYLVIDNGGAITLSNSASNALNQFNADGGIVTTLLGSGVTLANDQIAVAQQGLAEGTTTASMALPDMATAGAVANLTISNSAIGAGNAINIAISPLE